MLALPGVALTIFVALIGPLRRTDEKISQSAVEDDRATDAGPISGG
jgi:hypothetical protein